MPCPNNLLAVLVGAHTKQLVGAANPQRTASNSKVVRIPLHKGGAPSGHPPRNMAPEPAQDLEAFQGSLWVLPRRRPTMSAKPSPPHMSEKTATPTGDSLQYTNVAPSSTNT